jgi:plasmid stabilization system protein ParE
VKYRVRLTPRALRDAEDVLRWFHKHEADAAGTRWYEAILDRIDTLERQPDRCPLTADAVDLGVELRELHFGRRPGVYRILFIIDRGTVHTPYPTRGAGRGED